MSSSFAMPKSVTLAITLPVKERCCWKGLDGRYYWSGGMRELEQCHDICLLGCGREWTVQSSLENGLGCHPSAPLKVLADQCDSVTILVHS